MFENLLWDELEEKHKEKWDYLEEKYHLQSLHRSHAFMAYAKEPPPNYGAWALYNTLDFYSIAQYCLNVCYHYIFDSDYAVDISEYPWLREYDASDPDDRFYKVHEMIGIEGRKRSLDKEGRLLYAELKNAFCRHLVVSFLHRFYCDNLEPMESKNCIEVLMASFPKYDLEKCKDSVEKAGVNEARKEFRKERRNKFAVFCHSLETLERTTERRSADGKICLTPEMLLRAPNWIFSFAMAEIWTKSLFYDKKQNPTLEMRIDSFFRKKEKSTRGAGRVIDSQIDSITRGMFTPLLVARWNPEKDKEGSAPIGFETSHNDRHHIKPIKSQVYKSLITGGSYQISDGWQFLFNNYLLESSFHLCAIKKIQEIMDSEDQSIWEDLLPLTTVLRLNAPLVHVDLLDFLYKKLKRDHILYKIVYKSDGEACDSFFKELNNRIDHWNTYGLPILEEFFTWVVYTHYSCDDILSISKNARNDIGRDIDKLEELHEEVGVLVEYSKYRRYPELEDIIRDIDLPTTLESYKIVPTDYVEYSRKRKNQKDIDAKVAKLSYRATLGYYSDGDQEVYVDPTQRVFIN